MCASRPYPQAERISRWRRRHVQNAASDRRRLPPPLPYRKAASGVTAEVTSGVDTLWVARRVTSRQLVGRSGQLAALRSAADSAAGSSARVVLVAGDAGIGKT